MKIMRIIRARETVAGIGMCVAAATYSCTRQSVSEQTHGHIANTSASKPSEVHLKNPVLTPETESAPAEYVVGPENSLPRFDKYVTWNDNGAETNEEVEYILDGRPIGKGETGIRSLIQEFHKLRPGTRVLFYPVFLMGKPSGGLFISPPYAEHSDEIWAAARLNHLIVIESQRDHLGNLVSRPRP